MFITYAFKRVFKHIIYKHIASFSIFYLVNCRDEFENVLVLQFVLNEETFFVFKRIAGREERDPEIKREG